MAFSFLLENLTCSFNGFKSCPIQKRVMGSKILVHKPLKPVQCVSVQNLENETVIRRTANYERTEWNDNFLQSLNSIYTSDVHIARAHILKRKVRAMIGGVSEMGDQIELIDSLQRLGLSYHFEDEIKMMLQKIHESGTWENDSLHLTALKFKLFRQYGFPVSEEVFNSFLDKSGSFKTCVSEDVEGMLSLYEASYLSFESENIMEEAWKFTTQQLQNLKFDTTDTNLALEVKHALELPLHWRPNRVETRWFIDHYATKEDFNPTLLEFAKLDYNIVQALYQQEIKETSRWWEKSDLGDSELGFARDSLVICYIWTITTGYEPKYSSWRVLNTKINNLLTSIDDIYDVHGTLEELELFTEVFPRWDITEMKNLPKYMRIYFFAVLNVVNGMIYDALKYQDMDISFYVRNVWKCLFHAYLLEARWFNSGYKPTMEEFLENAQISCTAPVMMLSQYMSAYPIVTEELEYLSTNPDIFLCSCKIVRLVNDLGNSSDELKRGDVPKSVQCYMNDTGVSENEAREHVKELIRRLWKKFNTYRATDPILSQTTIEFLMNHARTTHIVYLYGDGHAKREKTNILASPLVFEPIPM